MEKASQVSEYGHFYNEIGPKPISSTALQPNPFTKWIKPAAGAGNALTVVTTGLEVGGICLLSRDSVEKKSAKIAFAIGANATGYLLVAALIGGTISTAPVWASAAVGVATVAGISLAVSTAKQIYNRNIDGK